VTRDETIPRTFAEKAKLDIAANRLIDAVKARIPVDLIVHTRGMHRKFLRADSAFSREITQKGRVLYEEGKPSSMEAAMFADLARQTHDTIKRRLGLRHCEGGALKHAPPLSTFLSHPLPPPADVKC